MNVAVLTLLLRASKFYGQSNYYCLPVGTSGFPATLPAIFQYYPEAISVNDCSRSLRY